MTKTASSMFIPPQGAMRFEVTQGPHSIHARLENPFVVWVAPAMPIRVHVQGCICWVGFPVLQMPNEPVMYRTNWERALREHARVMVCTCFGRIIE